MNEDKEMLQHFDKTFGTNTIKHIKLNMPLLKYFFYNFEEDFRKPSPKFKELRKKQTELSEKIHKHLIQNRRNYLMNIVTQQICW